MNRRDWVRWRGTMLVAAAVAGLAVLRPWTVQPIATATPATFDPVSYVSSIWQARVLPEADRLAVDVPVAVRDAPAAAAGSPPVRRAVFVKGTATVAEIDRRSQVGLARLRFSDPAGPANAALQVGPVVRGTALRDALEFIRFTDFVNQIEFASVAGALNERAAQDVLAPLDVEHLPGQRIAFVGAVTIGPATSTAPLDILPVKIEILGDAR